jgi:hydrogenase/urease accessory protein HupE
MTETWIADVAAELEVDPDVVDIAALLGLARDVAHGVERKAAPLSTFVVGYAAGAKAADAAGVAELIEYVRRMCPPPDDSTA